MAESRVEARLDRSRPTVAGGVVLFGLLLTLSGRPPTAADPQVLASLMLLLLVLAVVGTAVPLVAVRRVRVSASSPRDAMVGDEVPITLVLDRGRGIEVRFLDPTGPWHRAGPGTGMLGHRADRRGHFEVLRLELRTTRPLGLWAGHRVLSLVLDAPIHVGPRPLQVRWMPEPTPLEEGSDPLRTGRVRGDLVRSVRPYAPGDAPRSVHWPSTARTGQLVVRELEPPVPMGQAIVVDLRGLGDETERAASYAAGACRAVLAAGGQLVLSTCEAAGPVTAPVHTPLEAGRRLARAVSGAPGLPPEGWPLVEIGR